MERTGFDTATVLETDGAFATVITNKSKSCNECGKAQAGICGKSGTGMIIKANNRLNAVKGDEVTIELDSKSHAQGYFYFFVLPVIALIAGTYSGYLISESAGIKGLDVIAGIVFLVISIAYALIKVQKLDRSTQFEITRILHKQPESPAIACSEELDYLERFKRTA